MITLRIEAGADPWAPHEEALHRAAALIGRPIVVHLCHRASLPRRWAACHDGRPPTAAPYAFRAWSQAQRGACWLLVDPTETRASVTWLLFHELGHLALPAAPLLHSLLRGQPRPADYLDDDDAHEAVAEEQLCNSVATLALQQLGLPAPHALDRRWWRRRVRAA